MRETLTIFPEQILKERLAQQRGKDRVVNEFSGSLQVRVAETWEEIEAAFALRYRVFYEEMSARPSAEVAALKRDFDEFDPYCEHLVVLDNDKGTGADAVVGTYRMLRRAGASEIGRFYSSDEYNIAPIIAADGDILEMGRSCIDAEHRTRSAMQLLWRGVTAYVLGHNIRFLFGCASLHGTDTARMAVPLSYLWHNHLAPERLRATALPERYVSMNLMPAADIEVKKAVRFLPPMIRGYLRLGGWVGDGAVIDHEFNTVDVFVLVEMDKVTDKYFKHYTRDLALDTGAGGGGGDAEARRASSRGTVTRD